MRRREFISLIGGTAAAWPLAARAQQPNALRRVAVLQTLAENDLEGQSWVNALKQGLAVLGWTDGLTIRLDVRWAGGDANLIQRFAKELVDLHPDVIVAVATPSAMAFRQETHTIPIVFTSVTDPVAQGLVESLIRPGGNITGFTIFEPEIGSKWMQVLKDIAPETTRTAAIFNPDTAPYYRLYMSSIEAGGASFGEDI